MDGQLAPAERTRVKAHLHSCPSCREELRTLEWTRSLLQQVPTVPVPRSFVIREADLVPQRTTRPRGLALQWATALVAVLLVVVVAGDMFFNARLAAPESQPEIAMLALSTPTAAPTAAMERAAAAEETEAKAAPQEDAQVGTPAEAPKREIVPSPTGETVETGKTAQPVTVMGGGGPVTGTTTAQPMVVEVAPSTSPVAPPPEGNVVPQGTAELVPEPSLGQQVPGEQDVETVEKAPDLRQHGGTPLAMAPPVAPPLDQADRQTDEGLRETQSRLPLIVARLGWRVAEVGLGLLMVGLIVVLIWRRRRN
jgi:anti-sigma factor RsiW